MDYPYITMIKSHNNQIIMEGCNIEKNFKVIATKSFLFDDYDIKICYTEKNNDRTKIYTFFNVFESGFYLPKELIIKIYFMITNYQN